MCIIHLKIQVGYAAVNALLGPSSLNIRAFPADVVGITNYLDVGFQVC